MSRETQNRLPGVRVVSGGSAYLAHVLPEDGADELAVGRVAEDVGAVGLRWLAVVLAELALAAAADVGDGRGGPGDVRAALKDTSVLHDMTCVFYLT